VVLECAGHQAVRAHGLCCLEAGADLALTSVGARPPKAAMPVSGR
jgi:predicted dinucleotide-utilizing enzyme